MLSIIVPIGDEYFDESLGENGEFVIPQGTPLDLEHSLASLSKWESIWEKPFLGSTDKTKEETFSYIKCMILDETVDDSIVDHFTNENIQAVNDYINSKMTATWFAEIDDKKPASREIITAEIVYYWMIALQIPFECDRWHLNQLITLIRVCNQKNAPAKKMTPKDRQDRAQQMRELNARRRAEMGTSG